MFLKYDGNGAHFAIATADKPEGPFTFQEQTLVDGALMGNMSVSQDDDGKAYLCYVSWAVGTNAQHGIYLPSAGSAKSGDAAAALDGKPDAMWTPAEGQTELVVDLGGTYDAVHKVRLHFAAGDVGVKWEPVPDKTDTATYTVRGETKVQASQKGRGKVMTQVNATVHVGG